MNQYHKNFITGAKAWMARAGIRTVLEAAKALNIGRVAFYKVMDGTNKPTADLGIKLCEAAGISANWLFLNRGEMEMDRANHLETVIGRIDALEKSIREIVNKKPEKLRQTGKK